MQNKFDIEAVERIANGPAIGLKDALEAIYGLLPNCGETEQERLIAAYRKRFKPSLPEGEKVLIKD